MSNSILKRMCDHIDAWPGLVGTSSDEQVVWFRKLFELRTEGKRLLRAPTDNKCHVDLTRTDEYDGLVVPDADMEVCLKVLRTVRNAALSGDELDSNTAVLLSHAHAGLVSMVQEVMKSEAE